MNEGLGRYEVRLDRKLERMLAIAAPQGPAAGGDQGLISLARRRPPIICTACSRGRRNHDTRPLHCGKPYRWKDILELRRAQLAAAGAAQASELAPFSTMHDDRLPPAERTASGR
jgi:hypothetical protein